jgi:hypothetical protein
MMQQHYIAVVLVVLLVKEERERERERERTCYTPSAVCIDADGLGKTFQLESVDAGHARSFSPVFFFFFFFLLYLAWLPSRFILFISGGRKK